MPKQKAKTRQPQHQAQQPGREAQMAPRPQVARAEYRGSRKLQGKAALITGGDSGIGRAVAVLFAREGADVSVTYLNEHEDAHETRRLVEAEGRRCILYPGDLGDDSICVRMVEDTVHQLGRLDILVNNAAEQHLQEDIRKLSNEQLQRTFRTNIFAHFYVTRAALKHLGPGSAIINTASVTAYRGNPQLLDYSATKGAIVAFTRSLSRALAGQGIRVNAVAPGPIWTPLIPATFPPEKVSEFGAQVPLGRPGEPMEIAPSYVFLACSDSSYMTGQVLHPNGGEIVNG